MELDESQHSERTVFIPPPEAGTNQTPIIYKSFKLDPELMRPQKNFCLKNPSLSAFGMVPGSPMARRTKHEIKVAQRMARKQVNKKIILCIKKWIFASKYACMICFSGCNAR